MEGSDYKNNQFKHDYSSRMCNYSSFIEGVKDRVNTCQIIEVLHLIDMEF